MVVPEAVFRILLEALSDNPHMALWWPALDSANDICPAMLEAVETRKQCCEGGRHHGYFVINVNDTSLVGAGR